MATIDQLVPLLQILVYTTTANVDVFADAVTEYNIYFESSGSSIEGYLYVGEQQVSSGHVSLQAGSAEEAESRSETVGEDGYYFFKDVPQGDFSLRGSVGYPSRMKGVGGVLGEDEALRVDLMMFEGVSIRCTLENLRPETLLPMVFLLHGAQNVGPEYTPGVFQMLDSQNLAIANAWDGTALFENVETGVYTLVALDLPYSTELGWVHEEGIMTVVQVEISGEGDGEVVLSF